MGKIILAFSLALLLVTSSFATEVVQSKKFNKNPSWETCLVLSEYHETGMPTSGYQLSMMLFEAKIGYSGISVKGMDLLAASCDRDVDDVEGIRESLKSTYKYLLDPAVEYSLNYQYSKASYSLELSELMDKLYFGQLKTSGEEDIKVVTLAHEENVAILKQVVLFNEYLTKLDRDYLNKVEKFCYIEPEYCLLISNF